MTDDLSLRQEHELAQKIANLVFPLIRQSFVVARSGRASMNEQKVRILFKALDATAPLIDADPNLTEPEKLLAHGVFSMITKPYKNGNIPHRRLLILATFANFCFNLFEQAASFVELEVPDVDEEVIEAEAREVVNVEPP